MGCVQLLSQSPLYLAPILRALSLSSLWIGVYIGSTEEEEEEVYLHEMCAALVPVSLVLGSHLECLVSQLTLGGGLYGK